jgi:PAS domain S-box-containing protein
MREPTPSAADLLEELRSLRQRVADLERRHDQLRASDAQYQQLVENAPLGIYRTTPDGRVLYANQVAVRMVGFESFADMALHNIEQIGTAFTYPRQVFKERLEREGEIKGLEASWRKRDGTMLYVRENARVVRGPDGAVLYYEGTLEDITEKKEAEQALRQARDELESRVCLRTAELAQANAELSKENAERRRAEEALRESLDLLQAIVEGTPDVIVVKDPKGRYLLTNSAAVRLLGKPMVELPGSEGADAFAPATYRQIREDDLRVMASGVQETFERLFTVGNVTRSYLVTKGPYRDTEGRIAGVIGIARDVTEQKRLEEQFRQAQKMDAVGRLAGGIAHDFNNLLTAILGFTDLLLAAVPEDSSLRLDLDQIRKASERAVTLTSQLLAFGRKQLVQPRILDLNAVVRDFLTMLHRLISENIELVTVLAPELRPVKADRGQIEQVLLNLVVNARDALPQGGKIVLETSNSAVDESFARANLGVSPGLYTRLTVRDTGCGMDEHTQAHLFEPFFSTKGVGKGAGLGLATVYGIVKQNHGHIAVHSEVGQGTTLEIYLPSVEDPVIPVWQAGAPAGHAKAGETVLVVEDEKILRALIETILLQQGYTVLKAADGRAALRLAQSTAQPIHLVVTDVVMPGMSGRQLADQLRALCAGLKVLFISGYTDEALLRQGNLGPGTGFLDKPFAPEKLLHQVRAVLDG